MFVKVIIMSLSVILNILYRTRQLQKRKVDCCSPYFFFLL